MSPTPTANISSKSPPPPSRHPEHDSHSPSPHVHRPHSSPPPPPSHPSPPVQRAPASRPSKRQRACRPPTMAAEHASSGSDSSSQSGIADNETEAEPGHPSRHSASLTDPPKKKRTRTLTTPHQSAALHALLAKSRFPTTAMREEVGRQIGLSARKVQIWFQNQRQKARRPQSDSAPLTRPPQFGPFPIITSAGPSSSSYPSPPTGGPASQDSHSAPTSTQSAHGSAASPDSIPALPGPTLPSWPPPSYQRAPPPTEERDPPRRPPTSPQTPLATSPHLRLSPGITVRDARASTRGPAPHPTQPTPVGTSPQFSGMLPPITLSALGSHGSTEPYASATSFPPQPPSLTFVNTTQRYHSSPPRPAIERGSPVVSIPPPFVLQPQPQWDPQTFAPYTRPQFTSWLQSSGSAPSSARTSSSSAGPHDRVMHPLSPDASRRRHFYSSSGEPGLRSHHIFSPQPSRHQRFSTSASSPASVSVSREGRARSEDGGGEE